MAARRRKTRSAAPRKRDYAAEYRRRVAGTKKGSPERQRKRGKKPGETAAVKERREEYVEIWGATRAEMKRLRKRAFDHVLAITTGWNDTGDANSDHKPHKWVDEPVRETIRRNMNNLTADLLEMVLSETYDTALSIIGPDPTEEGVNGELFNPWWYH